MRSSRLLIRVVGLLAAMLCARAAHATPIAYDEGVSGDLNTLLPGALFALDAGSNTVKGTTFFIPLQNPSDDADSFAFTVPVGMHLTDITYSFAVSLLPVTTVAQATYRLDNGNAAPVSPFLGTLTVDMLGATTLHPFGGALPLGPGAYGLSEQVLTSTTAGGWTTNYTWTLTVAEDSTAVPEPVSLCLFGTGLAAVWMRRRRRA